MWRKLWQKLRERYSVVPATLALQSARRQHEAPDILLRRLHWTVLRPLATSLGGTERSLFRGPGMEFTETRSYQPGDDIRFIDWNATARTEEPMVREAHSERALDVWFLLDLSASVNWGTAACLKRDSAVEFTAIAGQILGRTGNRLGAVLFAERPLGIIPPAAGRLHLLHLLRQIREKSNQTASQGQTDMAEILRYVSSVIRRRSLVLVVSDFLVPDGWFLQLGALARRHEVVAVRLYDPREGELPDVGFVTLEDPETGRQVHVDTSNLKLRESFRQAAESQTAQIQARLQKCGVDSVTISTHDELMPALLRFLQARRIRATCRGSAFVSSSMQRKL